MFVLGFSTVFVALGASASLIGSLIHAWSAELSIVAGIVIIIMGLHFLGLTRIDLLMREGRLPIPKPVGLWGAYVMGLAFAFGWTPCIGPILAAILSIAASEATVEKGAGLLAVYSAGLGIPFLIAAFMVEQFSSLFARMKRHLARVERAMGVLLVITGIGFLTGSVSTVSIWLLETFPESAELRLVRGSRERCLKIAVGNRRINHGAQLAPDRVAVEGNTCVMKMAISSSAGSIQNDVVAAPPHAYSPGLPGMSVCAGSSVTEKPRPKPMPL